LQRGVYFAVKFRNRVRELRRVKAADLVPNPRNWRTHPKGQQDALRGILAEVGYADALLARELPDGSLMLVDGHLRAETTPDQEVPVLVLDISEAEADKLLLSLDPLAALAETNAVALDALLREVDTGSEGLQQMYADLAEAAELYQDDAKEIVEDEIPEPPVDPITKPGDLWLLSDHRLLCGDSTKAEDVERLMDGAKAEMVFTDPPYGVNIQGGKNNNTIAGDLTQTAIPFSFDLSVSIATVESARFYFCGAEVNLHLYHKLFERHCRQLPRHLIWVKNGFSMKPNGYHNQYEIIFHGYKPGGGGLNKWFGPRTEEFASDIWQISRDASSTYQHPTQKPVALPARAIGNSSPPGGLVFEPFGGSGSTFIAAEQLGRKCYGMEISPAYCDVIVKRWETLTGKKATLEVNDGQARPATGADHHQDGEGQPRQKASQQKRAKAAKR
jgi:DNA modification methylase